MKTKLTFACLLVLLSIAGKAFADAAPPSVTGITAQSAGGQVIVQWNPVTSDPIDHYRVYYSSQSILDNNGLYDDFETTDGDQTTLTFVPPQGMTELFVAVIAVAQSGLESEFFAEEASVRVTAQDSSAAFSSAAFQSIPDTPTHVSVKLLKASVPSPEEIVAEFSASVTVDPVRAPEGLTVTKPDGGALQITSITISDKIITIHTVEQERGVVYNVAFSEPFMGKNGQQLDVDDRSLLVTGHADGTTPVAASPAVPALPAGTPTSPPDIQNATIVPQIQQNGAYMITMEWQVNNASGDLYGIVVYQTRDGVNFGPPSLLPIDIRGVQLQDVTPGFFGVYIQTVNVYGYVSPGVFQYATLPPYVPGYGFQGDLTFGSMKPGVESVGETPEGMAQIEAITEETPTATIEGVDHSAAAETLFNWKSAGILAGSAAGTAILFLFLCLLCVKRRCSME